MRLTELSNVFEGGKALADIGVRRIKKGDILPTIKHVSDVTGIPEEDLHQLGSVGKTESSGDIDLGVDVNKFNAEHIDALLKSKGIAGSYNKGNKVGSYAFPIKGDPENGYVQVDFMYTTNPEWAKFSYFSAGEGSRYKGVVRTVLINSVAAILEEPGVDYFEYLPKGELSVRVGRSLDLSSGLKRLYQYRPKKISGEGYLKSMKSVSPEDFKKMFPHVQVKGGKSLIDDPEKVLKVLFGRGTTSKDVESAEQVIHLIKQKFTREQQAKIFRVAASRLRDKKGQIRLPPEIEEYL